MHFSSGATPPIYQFDKTSLSRDALLYSCHHTRKLDFDTVNHDDSILQLELPELCRNAFPVLTTTDNMLLCSAVACFSGYKPGGEAEPS